MRKIVSFLIIVVFLIVPVNAASSTDTNVEYVQKASFWTWAAEQNEFLHGLVGSTGASCPNSEDGYHHASSYKRPQASFGGLTDYYTCICDLCGAEFKAYEKDLQQSYEAQVAELPATGYQSDGSLLWSPTFVWWGLGSKSSRVYCSHYDGSKISDSRYLLHVIILLILFPFVWCQIHFFMLIINFMNLKVSFPLMVIIY